MLMKHRDIGTYYCPMTQGQGGGPYECDGPQCAAWQWYEPDCYGEERRGYCGMCGFSKHDDCRNVRGGCEHMDLTPDGPE